MAESNKPSNPKRDQKETDKSSQNRNERVENSSEKRRDDGTAKRKTVLAKPAPVDDLNDANSAKLVAPKKHAINVKLIDDEIEAEGDITAERRKPTRVDNKIPASLRDLRRARAIPNPMPRIILASIVLCRISAVPTWRKNAPCPIPAVRIKFKVAPCPIPVAQTPRKVDLCPIPAGSIKPKIADW